MGRRLLAPAELFPAGSTDISQRYVALSTGVRVRVAEGGAAGGEPVVMLPGWGSPVYMFRHAFTGLGDHGFRVVVAELRGFGLSDKPAARGAYSLDAYIADVDALLDALGIASAKLVGQSMAGALALHYALRRPTRVQRVVLINPVGLVPMPFLIATRVPPPALFRALGGRLIPRWVVRFILRRLVYANPDLVREEDIDQYWSPSQLPGYAYAARAALSEFDWRPVSDEAVATLAVPALVMLGAQDRLIDNTEADARRLPDSAVCTVPGGHSVQEETPVESYVAIARFLRGE
ncbi:MAG TPA: alpha/beta hydrolase [Gemmatimonadaceae bacterium]|jgi:pimeloyl-ACP methyl ester carboxylesterase|nr:alpha/beta hydrolase [Gemmatimonadaceae bacterium]